MSFGPQLNNVVIYQNDHLGTPQKLTAVNGAVVWAAKYSSFGQVTVDPLSIITNNLRFPGQYYDDETGLHYNYLRYYDPSTGRYLKADPIGLEGGINLFTYVLNNPVNLIDPEGLKTIKGPNFTCYSGPPRVVVTTNTVTREKEIFSFKMLHPEGYRPSVGGNLPGHGRPPIGPEIAVDWWLWEHAYKEFSIFEITKTVSIFTYMCVEDRENACETSDAFRWEYEQEEVNETERLTDQYKKWINRKLYKAGSNSWPLP